MHTHTHTHTHKYMVWHGIFDCFFEVSKIGTFNLPVMGMGLACLLVGRVGLTSSFGGGGLAFDCLTACFVCMRWHYMHMWRDDVKEAVVVVVPFCLLPLPSFPPSLQSPIIISIITFPYSNIDSVHTPSRLARHIQTDTHTHIHTNTSA